MNIDELKSYLQNAKSHYEDLSKLMEIQGKLNYTEQHKGKVKFIELLLFKLEK